MPKTLYLVRHAKSDWHSGESDFDRSINRRGLQDAPVMGQRMKDGDALPEQIFCSPAKRAVQTLENLDLGIDAVVFKEKIYEASTGDLLDIVQSVPDSYESAMLIGHNPAMTWLATLLTGVRIEGMPTCSIITIQLDSNHWKSAGACLAELLNFDHPQRSA